MRAVEEQLVAVFPALRDGVRAQYPNAVTFEHLTSQANLPSGVHIASAWRTEPLMRYTLNLTALTDAEVATLEGFFRARQGRFEQFTYIDPTANLLKYSEDFSQTEWTKACSVGAATDDPFGGTSATVLAGDGSGNSSLRQTVSLDAGVAGSPACFSVYLRAVTAAGSINVSVTDGTNTVTRACALSTTGWSRAVVPWTFGATGLATVSISGGGWTGTSQIAVYGPMFCMTPGPAAYVATPAFYAVHPRCRFDQDEFVATYRGPNQTDVTLKIAEFYQYQQLPIASATLHTLTSFVKGGAGTAVVSLADSPLSESSRIDGGSSDYTLHTCNYSVPSPTWDSLNALKVWCWDFYTAAADIDGTYHNIPGPCQLLIYDVWIDVTYVDGSTGVWRPCVAALVNPASSYGLVSSPGNAIDTDNATYATIDRFAFHPLADYDICGLALSDFYRS
jgi:hypothetical protein